MTEAETLYAGILGGPELLAWFGRVPSFHDAEVVRVVLNRRAPSTLSVHTWRLTNQVDAQSYFILDRHAVVTFELEDVLDVQLEHFSPQNVIFGLQLRRATTRPDRMPHYFGDASPDDFEIELDPCYGLSGYVRCRRISISFVPGKPADA